MASNSFGTLFRITTWGESHGKAIGVVIDGCPAGLEISEEEIHQELILRSPGQNPYVTPRKETDLPEILSGVFDGKTTGAPLSILIPNRNADSTPYHIIKEMLRPGHANYPYLNKYGTFDYRGGGRASARETACRVAAGAVAKKILKHHNISLVAYLQEAGGVSASIPLENIETTRTRTQQSPVFCPDENTATAIMECIATAAQEGDSIGGVVAFCITGLPVGLGDPIYEKMEANLAKAMMSLPATKGFEIGEGFQATRMQGSTHNDIFQSDGKNITTQTNYAGGTLAGITTGMPLVGKIAFKPPSGIKKAQPTITLKKKEVTLALPKGSKHDPCVAIRAVPVVEAMCALVIADALLMNRASRL